MAWHPPGAVANRQPTRARLGETKLVGEGECWSGKGHQPTRAVQPFLAHARGRAIGFGAHGELHLKPRPFPDVDTTRIRPLCISTICLATPRPRPVPRVRLAQNARPSRGSNAALACEIRVVGKSTASS